MTTKVAKRHVAIAITAALFFSLPALVIYGKRTVKTKHIGLCGHECTTSENMKDFQDEEMPHATNPKHKLIRGKCITVIAFTVTFAFILSYLPYVVIMTVRSVQTLTFHSDGVWFVTYNILIRSYFISSMINPLVFGFMSLRFRQECFNVGFSKCSWERRQ
ncbi:LOW QUALITY PROTEIN: apelin receptor B-like [Haliotis rubra]|uniref:LOW QUALITY PROTEIN: apelin receptor B-like n=1 Tax=Haliotis rubra TaxID=36100 RepID=UPI001EE62D81|nr:LOW QUALITY PROTEIN: apelin receptor B-like [Haliotis rubra]